MGWFRRRNESNETREDQRNADIPPPLMAMLDSVQGMDRKPPVTLVLMGVMYLLHVQVARTPSMVLPFALCPEKVVAKKQIGAMFVAPFIHAQEMYLYQSMLSLMWKGYKLEGRLGSVGFCVLLLYLIALTQALIVFGAHLISWSAMRECFTGFSGVLTAMKVILNVNSPTFTKLYSFKVPTKYAAWLELFITYLLVPKLPLLAQAAGLLAGYIYVVIPNADALVGHAAYYVQQLLIKLGLARKPFQWWQFWPKFVESMRKRRRLRAARQE